MCVIITAQAGIDIPEVHFERAVEVNADGYGAVLRNKTTGTLRTVYSLTDKDPATKIARDVENEDILFHARWATQGSVKLANTHPFKIGDVYAAHNGHMTTFAELATFRGKDEVDSYVFFQTLASLGALKYTNSKWRKRIGTRIPNQRVAFIGSKGVYHVNPALWTERDGAFYSNTGPLYPTRTSADYKTWSFGSGQSTSQTERLKGWTYDKGVWTRDAEDIGHPVVSTYDQWLRERTTTNTNLEGRVREHPYYANQRLSEIATILDQQPLPDADDPQGSGDENTAYRAFIEDNCPAGAEVVYSDDGTGYYKLGDGRILNDQGEVIYHDDVVDMEPSDFALATSPVTSPNVASAPTRALACADTGGCATAVAERPTQAYTYHSILARSTSIETIIAGPTHVETLMDGMYRALSRQSTTNQINDIEAAGAKELAEAMRDVIDAMERVRSERVYISG